MERTIGSRCSLSRTWRATNGRDWRGPRRGKADRRTRRRKPIDPRRCVCSPTSGLCLRSLLSIVRHRQPWLPSWPRMRMGHGPAYGRRGKPITQRRSRHFAVRLHDPLRRRDPSRATFPYRRARSRKVTLGTTLRTPSSRYLSPSTLSQSATPLQTNDIQRLEGKIIRYAGLLCSG